MTTKLKLLCGDTLEVLKPGLRREPVADLQIHREYVDFDDKESQVIGMDYSSLVPVIQWLTLLHAELKVKGEIK